MSRQFRTLPSAVATLLALSMGACSDVPTTILVPSGPAASATKFWEVGSSVAWNRTARELISTRADAFIQPFRRASSPTFRSRSTTPSWRPKRRRSVACTHHRQRRQRVHLSSC